MKETIRKVLFLSALIAILVSLPALAFAENKEQGTEKQEPQAQGQQGQEGEDAWTRVLVKIGNVEITQQEFELQFRAAMERMSAANRQLFMNAHGRRQFLNMMADEKIWVNGALEMGLDKDQEVMLLTRMSRDQVLMHKFYEKAIYEKAKPTESELQKFYDANHDKFLGPVTIRPRQMVLPDSASAVQALKELKAGANFAKLARERSIDSVTALNGGDLGRLLEGRALPASVGGSEEYAATLFRLKKGELSDIVRTNLGYHIAKMEERIEAELRPFEEVKDRIESGLLSERSAKLRRELLEDLKGRYPVEHMIEDSSVAPGGEAAMPPKVANSPEELFQAAMDSKDSNQRISIYQELIKRFPDSKYAGQAQFMIGFIHSEELKDYDKAEEAFRLLLRKYPESELADSARWMLENMRDTSKKVGTVDDVKRKAQETTE